MTTLVYKAMASHPSELLLHLMAQQPYNSSSKASCQSLKIKAHVEACILRRVCCIVRALSNAKSFLIKLLKFTATITNKKTSNHVRKMNKRKKMKMILKSIAMGCNWPSSHVIPMPEPASQTYYDSTWNSVVVVDDDDDDGLERQLSGYLAWLEENESSSGNDNDKDASEIDQLAEKFIASCHEKFRLEKQESYRRYQEMLARSL